MRGMAGIFIIYASLLSSAWAFDPQSILEMHKNINAIQTELIKIPTKDVKALERIKTVQGELKKLRDRLVTYEAKLNENNPLMDDNQVISQPLENPYSEKLAPLLPARQAPNVSMSISVTKRTTLGEINTVPDILLEAAPQANSAIAPETKEIGFLGTQAPDIVAFNQAKGYFDDENYARAERGFNQFIRVYRDSSLVSNAYYWLGESYYMRDDYRTATHVYYRGYSRDKNGAKAPDNLYKLAQSLIKLDNKADACSVFLSLSNNYSLAYPELSAKAIEAQKVNACF